MAQLLHPPSDSVILNGETLKTLQSETPCNASADKLFDDMDLWRPGRMHRVAADPLVRASPPLRTTERCLPMDAILPMT
jgi:hypothetical protein